MTKILLFGKNGQLGKALQRSLAQVGDVLALDRYAINYCGDLTKPVHLTKTVLDYKPDFIVNAAGYTKVDEAEIEFELANLINCEAPAALSKAAKAIDACMIDFSTDYVFDGSGTHYRKEEEMASPLNAYGLSKKNGEDAIVISGCKYLIFRTSWVYAVRGENFIKTMLHKAKNLEKLTVINNQHGAPTSAELIADVTALAITRMLNERNLSFSGIYNLVASGETNWFDYARYVIQQSKALKPDLPWKVTNIVPVSSSEYPSLAKRPLNSRLSTKKLQKVFGIVLPPWQQGVNRMLAEMP